MTQNRSRAFVFTQYDYEQNGALDYWRAFDCRYIIFGKEVCPSTNRAHLQGYVAMPNAVSLKAIIKKTAKFKTHIEIAGGNSLQNYKYCSKDQDYYEKGTRPATNQEKGVTEKRRWEEAFDNAKKGALDDIPSDIMLRYYNTIKKIKSDYRPRPDDLPSAEHYGEWIYGPTGTGKSYYARTTFPGAFLKDKNKWWDQYNDEDVVIIDELDKTDQWIAGFVKKWADRYAFKGEYKGGSMIMRPKWIVITSNHPPSSIFTDEDLRAIERRFQLRLFDKPYKI